MTSVKPKPDPDNNQENEDIIFNLGEMLVKENLKFNKHVQSFANAIASANPTTYDAQGREMKPGSLKYRKLAKFLNNPENPGFQFSISELRSLDRYFSMNGQSLCVLPIFYRKKNLLDYIAENSEISFAMATRYTRAVNTETISRWDLRAMKLLFNRGKFERSRTDVLDVFHHGGVVDAIKNEDWNLYFVRRRASIVSFGGPFTCHATERLLAEIFSVKPYTLPQIDPEKRLPLYFSWRLKRDRQGVDRSAFQINRRQIKSLYAEDSPVRKEVEDCNRGLIVGDRWYSTEPIGKSYGLFVAQRQDARRIFGAIVGTYGPDTFAVAECLVESRITGILPPYDGTDGPQTVLIAIVETHTDVRVDKVADRENRVICSPQPRVCEILLCERDDNEVWHYNRKS